MAKIEKITSPLKAQKIRALPEIKGLLRWYHRQKRVLPWRSNPNPYWVWVSEVMLQQTQVTTVLPYFLRWVDRFPNVETLAQAQEEEVVSLWSGLGYYSRARSLHQGAKQIGELGRFPQSKEEWLLIRGVGPYTAGAICSIALNQVEPLVDGNVERVFSRVFCMGRIKQGEKKFLKALWDLAESSIVSAAKQKIQPRDFNQALMELGALVCTPKSPKCGQCPLHSKCAARLSDTVSLFPEKKVRPQKVRVRDLRVCIVQRRTTGPREKTEWGIWLRPERKWRKGTYDFLESPEVFLENAPNSLGSVRTQHVVTHHEIDRTTQVYVLKTATPKLCKVHDAKWISLSRGLNGLPLNSAFSKSWKLVLKTFPGIARGDF